MCGKYQNAKKIQSEEVTGEYEDDVAGGRGVLIVSCSAMPLPQGLLSVTFMAIISNHCLGVPGLL